MPTTSDKQVKTLDSWKEIATFLRRGVRTVQRWERTEGLPVRRHQHMKRGSVYALASELITWQEGRREYRARTNGLSGNLLHGEFDRMRTLLSRQTLLAQQIKDLLATSASWNGNLRALRTQANDSARRGPTSTEISAAPQPSPVRLPDIVGA